MLHNQVAIITGGASGIGKATSILFAQSGARVVVADWDRDSGNRIVEEIQSFAGKDAAQFICTDVSNEDDVKLLMSQTISIYGKLNVLYNNASVPLSKDLELVLQEEWQRLMDINLKSVFLTVKHAIPHLRRTKGSIVNMASLNGLVGQRTNALYASSKGAVIAMTKSLALDYAPDGVRVNCICPAGVLTPLLESWIQQQSDPAATRESLNRMHPLGGIASPEDIAKAVLYLASDLAGFVTGVALPVDGGASLGY